MESPIALLYEFVYRPFEEILDGLRFFSFEEDKARAIQLLEAARNHDRLAPDRRFRIAPRIKEELTSEGLRKHNRLYFGSVHFLIQITEDDIKQGINEYDFFRFSFLILD